MCNILTIAIVYCMSLLPSFPSSVLIYLSSISFNMNIFCVTMHAPSCIPSRSIKVYHGIWHAGYEVCSLLLSPNAQHYIIIVLNRIYLHCTARLDHIPLYNANMYVQKCTAASAAACRSSINALLGSCHPYASSTYHTVW